MQEEIERIFGPQVKEDTLRLVNGHLDWLSRLPSDVFVNMATFLDLPSIAKLSQVNSHFKVMCNLDRLWEKLYEQHSGGPDKVPEEVRKIASEVGWKKVYFTNKLQLRMQVGRMRQKSASKGYNQSHHVDTFVTQH
jgi:F-box protein 36